jgi:hypothetical protein
LRAHDLAKPVCFFCTDKAQFCIVAMAAAGFELDLAESKNARQRLLLNADILNSFIGDRACIAAEHAAFDADVMLADMIPKPRPCQPTEKQAEEQNGDHHANRDQRIAGPARTEHGGENRKDQLRDAGDEADK